jgi:hypothetical protein
VIGGQWSAVSLKSGADDISLTTKNFNDKTKAISFHPDSEN